MKDQNKTRTIEELEEIIAALDSALASQQQVNKAVYDRINTLDDAVRRIGDTQIKILDLLAGDSK